MFYKFLPLTILQICICTSIIGQTSFDLNFEYFGNKTMKSPWRSLYHTKKYQCSKQSYCGDFAAKLEAIPVIKYNDAIKNSIPYDNIKDIPTHFSGVFKYYSNSIIKGDAACILLHLIDTKSKDTIASAQLLIKEQNTEYKFFKIPLKYTGKCTNDAILNITISASQYALKHNNYPKKTGILYVDNLQLSRVMAEELILHEGENSRKNLRVPIINYTSPRTPFERLYE
jgi:hypothetical protein